MSSEHSSQEARQPIDLVQDVETSLPFGETNAKGRALKQRVCDAIDARSDMLRATSREIHEHPEIAFQEFHSATTLSECLRSEGLEVEMPAHGLQTAFTSEFGRDNAPVIGIIAEYDALPGLGHACGHNLIGTSALGAALGLAAIADQLPGKVRLIGTPAEEGGGGKVLMAREGAFEGLSCAMMVHPADRNLQSFSLIAACRLTATFTGATAHAAAEPERGINALDALVLAYNGISMLRQQIPADHRLHAIITEGGVATNIIPDRAVGEFGIRAPTRRQLALLRERVEACIRAGASATGASVAIERDPIEYHDLLINTPLEKAFRSNAEQLGRLFDDLQSLETGATASTDFGNVSQMVPAIHPMIAAVPPGTAFHTVEFATEAISPAALDAMLDAAKAMAMTAIDVICDENARMAMETAFEKEKKRAEAA